MSFVDDRPENVAAVIALATTTSSVADHLVRIPREGFTAVDGCALVAGHPIGAVQVAANLSKTDRAPLPADLDADAAGLQWTVNGYALSLASLILLGGSLGDRYGRRVHPGRNHVLDVP